MTADERETLRAIAARVAMHAIVLRAPLLHEPNPVAAASIEYADALIEALEK